MRGGRNPSIVPGAPKGWLNIQILILKWLVEMQIFSPQSTPIYFFLWLVVSSESILADNIYKSFIYFRREDSAAGRKALPSMGRSQSDVIIIIIIIFIIIVVIIITIISIIILITMSRQLGIVWQQSWQVTPRSKNRSPILTILMLMLVAGFFLDDHDPIYHPYDNFDVDAGGWFLTLKVCR